MAELSTHSVLEHNFLFHGLPRPTIDALASLAHHRLYDKGTLIFAQGDPGDALYGVTFGRIRIFTADEKGHEVFLNILGPGETFGEIALLDGLPRTASAVAIEPTKLVVIARSQFLSRLGEDLALSMDMMKLLCARLRWVSNLLEESSFLAGPARVAKRLSNLAETYGRPLPSGDTELVISQAELGQFLGISRQIINQYLQIWSASGWVVLKRGRIIVHDIKALKAVAAQSERLAH
jgi:CRP-like cAMP-binding protein